MYTNVNGTRLFFDIEGAALDFNGSVVTEKPALVCLHGSFFDHSGFRPYLSPLSEHLQLIYIDFPGFGRSSSCGPNAWAINRLADSVVAVMDHLGLEKAHLAGHSFGALVANHIAINYPQRVGISCLLNPFTTDFDYCLKMIEEGGGTIARDAAKALLLNKDTEAIEDFFTYVTPLYFQRPPNQDWMARADPALPLVFASLDQAAIYNWHQRLGALEVETWICYGEKDIYHSPHYLADCLAELRKPHLKPFSFERSGHFLFVDELNKLLKLLRTLPNNN